MLYCFYFTDSFSKTKMPWNRILFQSMSSHIYKLLCHLLSSRLYCRLRNLTESCLTARGLYHR